VETVKRNLVRIGFHYEATTIAGGLVACTGNTGCKWASTNTKGQAVELARYLEKRVSLDQPINIHLTGCPNSCAQHYIGDIGLLGVKTMLGAESVEAYNVVLGGGYGHDQAIAKEVFKGIPFSALPQLLQRVLMAYKAKRKSGETFAEFTRRHEVKQLQEMFSE
jgi:ferredoxin-nitrite reductase